VLKENWRDEEVARMRGVVVKRFMSPPSDSALLCKEK